MALTIGKIDKSKQLWADCAGDRQTPGLVFNAGCLTPAHKMAAGDGDCTHGNHAPIWELSRDTDYNIDTMPDRFNDRSTRSPAEIYVGCSRYTDS